MEEEAAAPQFHHYQSMIKTILRYKRQHQRLLTLFRPGFSGPSGTRSPPSLTPRIAQSRGSISTPEIVSFEEEAVAAAAAPQLHYHQSTAIPPPPPPYFYCSSCKTAATLLNCGSDGGGIVMLWWII